MVVDIGADVVAGPGVGMHTSGVFATICRVITFGLACFLAKRKSLAFITDLTMTIIIITATEFQKKSKFDTQQEAD